MISIGITAFKEPKTIGKAIESFLANKMKDYEIIVSAPDKETLAVVKKHAKNNSRIKAIKDKGKGKPSALNNLLGRMNGEIVILSDGDVYVSNNSVKSLISHFRNKKVGCVTGRPVSVNDKKNIFGFWAYLLTESFHIERLNKIRKNKNIICSGYLYAFRKNLYQKIPEDVLADDAFNSFQIEKKNYKIDYEPKAKVYVKYPNNLPDWIRQKKRTAGRLYQLKNRFGLRLEKSFIEEFLAGIGAFRLVNSLIELVWLIMLIIMRAYIWARVLLDFRLWKRKFEKVWERVESTK